MNDVTMDVVRVVLCVCCFIGPILGADKCSEPAEERSSHTIIRYVNSLKRTFKWSFDRLGDSVLTECYLTKNYPCASIWPSSMYSSTMERSDGRYRVTLTIHNVSRVQDAERFKWMDGSTTIGECELDVYYFPSEPVCNDIKISRSRDTISWACLVDKYYPTIACLFEYKEGDGRHAPVPLRYLSSTQPSIFRVSLWDYYNNTCTMSLPVSHLSRGSYYFRFTANMYLNVLGSDNVLRKTAHSKEIKLELPQTEFKNCPGEDEYIKQGTSLTCGCDLVEKGNPTGVGQWLDSEFKVTNYGLVGGVLPLVLEYDPKDPRPTYRCRGHSSLGSGRIATYRPQFAYGPSDVNISVNNDHSTIDKCHSTVDIYVKCSVPMSSVNPKPTVDVQTSDHISTTSLFGFSEIGRHSYSYKIQSNTGGNFTVTCVASNSIFGDITVKKNKSIEIQEPPSSVPRLTVIGGQSKDDGIVTVTSGQIVDIQCLVIGGFPSVTKTIITCGSNKHVGDGHETAQTLTVVKELNRMKCVCEGEHVTGCYEKKSEVTINVLFMSDLVSFIVNSKWKRIEVSDGDNVTFLCEAEGNPRPSVTVKGQRSNNEVTFQDIQSGVYEIKSTGTKSMGCLDTDVYTCVADNGVGVGGVNKSLAVFVKCVPELPAWFGGTATNFSVTNGANVNISIPVAGYPEPTEFSLTRKTRHSSKTPVDKMDYKGTYLPGQPPEGVVELSMFDLMDSDSGQYVLTIENGIGDGLDYMFAITVLGQFKDTTDI